MRKNCGETAVKRILQSDDADSLKVLKLDVVVLKCIASSPMQKYAAAARQSVRDGVPFTAKVSDFFVSKAA